MREWQLTAKQAKIVSEEAKIRLRANPSHSEGWLVSLGHAQQYNGPIRGQGLQQARRQIWAALTRPSGTQIMQWLR